MNIKQTKNNELVLSDIETFFIQLKTGKKIKITIEDNDLIVHDLTNNIIYVTGTKPESIFSSKQKTNTVCLTFMYNGIAKKAFEFWNTQGKTIFETFISKRIKQKYKDVVFRIGDFTKPIYNFDIFKIDDVYQIDYIKGDKIVLMPIERSRYGNIDINKLITTGEKGITISTKTLQENFVKINYNY